MATRDLDRELRDRIDSFLSDLAGLVKRSALESVQEALSGASSTRRGPARTRKLGRPRKLGSAKRRDGRGAKRSGSALIGISNRLLAHVKRHPGQGVSQIASALRSSSQDLQLPVRKLVAKKQLRTTGRKRGTKYFAR